jgi:hypothetical protein
MMQRRIHRLSAIAAVTIFAAVVGACGSDGPAAGLDSGSAVEGAAAASPTDAPEAPAPTDAPAATDPAPEPTTPESGPEPTTPESGDADSDDNDWVLPVLLVGGLLLAAVIIGGVIGRSKKSAAPTSAPTTSSSPQASLLSTSQWITDQLTLELMAAPPAAAQQRWAVERSRLDNVAIGAQQQYLEAHDANWQPLAQNMSALAAAIDTNLALRAQDPPNAQLISESTDVINRHRATLQQLITALRQTTPR